MDVRVSSCLQDCAGNEGSLGVAHKSYIPIFVCDVLNHLRKHLDLILDRFHGVISIECIQAEHFYAWEIVFQVRLEVFEAFVRICQAVDENYRSNSEGETEQ